MSNEAEKLNHLRHSLAHLLAAAVLEMYPGTKNTIGPAIENGFYYDFDFVSPISDKDLPKIEKKMREMLKSWKSFESKEVKQKEALETYKDNLYKIELINEIANKKEKITFYTSGKFTDLCRGGHLENPAKEIKADAFKLDRVAGAYWRGDEKNKMLTRIYGLAFETREELDTYIAQVEEAKKRDHKKLGKELDLFTFSELVGAGLPLWTPNGTLIRDELDSFVWKLRQAVGYKRVDIPHITKKELYETSGHWDKFKDDLFRITTREGHEFAMKPMNCPHHTQIFARRQWSYREMPERYASTTKVYRDEQTGELAGLSRVRSITQDDAHVFCRNGQVKEEISKIYDIVKTFYGAFGFTLTPRLSLHDPKNMSAYLGTEEVWLKAEEELRSIVKKKGEIALEAVGEAAFYGPKIDFMAKDSLGREWQVATIMGSIERFLAILIEHLAGAFPLWLSPVQMSVMPISEAHHKFATEVYEKLKSSDIRAELNLDNESLGKKIRSFKLAKIPYAIVIGDKEVESKMLTVEKRDGTKENISVEDLLKKLKEEIKDHK